jgi:hypothetical protein
MNMLNNVDDMQQLGKSNMDAAMKSMESMSKTFQAIAAEVTSYATRSLQHQMAAMEKLMAAKAPEKVFEVQNEYIKAAYEGFTDQATRIGEL